MAESERSAEIIVYANDEEVMRVRSGDPQLATILANLPDLAERASAKMTRNVLDSQPAVRIAEGLRDARGD